MAFYLSSRAHLVARKEILVAILENIELRVVQLGVVIEGAVSLSYKTAHARATLRGELAVEDNDNASVGLGRDDGLPEQEVFHLVLLVQVQGSLKTADSTKGQTEELLGLRQFFTPLNQTHNFLAMEATMLIPCTTLPKMDPPK